MARHFPSSDGTPFSVQSRTLPGIHPQLQDFQSYAGVRRDARASKGTEPTARVPLKVMTSASCTMDRFIALRPVKLTATDYVEAENGLSPEERNRAAKTLNAHRGPGVRALSDGLYECCHGLKKRLLFQQSQGVLYFHTTGDRDGVRRFLERRI